MVVKVHETHSKYFKGHFQRFDCVPLITFSIPLKNLGPEPKVLPKNKIKLILEKKVLVTE